MSEEFSDFGEEDAAGTPMETAVPEPSEDFYKISVPALSLFFHLKQFLPICLLITIVALAIMLSGAPIWALFAFVFCYAVCCKISLKIAENRANAQKYFRNGNSLGCEKKTFGFFSKNTFPLDEVARISLVQTPLMRICKIWTIEFFVSGDRFSEVRFYGLEDAAKIHKSLIAARAALISSRTKLGVPEE